MKRKIYFSIATLSALVVILVTTFLVTTFYSFHIQNEIKALKDYGHLIATFLSPQVDLDIETLETSTKPDVRLTIMDLEGKVLFDNMADSNMMENHMNRPEVQSAIKSGEGEAVRHSETLDENTYYYAVLLPNNLILRLSRQGTTILNHFKNMVPFIVIGIGLIIALSLFTSSLLSKNIVKPVNDMTRNIEQLTNSKNLDDLVVYDEIIPFVNKVKHQDHEIKDNQKTLKEKAVLLDVISSSMDEGLILLDEDKKILSTNERGILLLEGNHNIAYHGEDIIKLTRNRKLNEVLEKSVQSNSSSELTLKQGEKYLDVFINPVLSDGGLIGLVLLIVDVTKKYKLDRMRSEFSANVSHELKTPLTSINGYAELIESGMVKEEDIAKFASRIRSEGIRLLNLIDAIIKLSKIEERVQADTFQLIDLYNLGEKMTQQLNLIAQEKNIDLRFSGEPSLLMGNEQMLEELIYNLVDNAIKYTSSGGEVSLTIENQGNQRMIKVCDTGIGISSSEQNRVFERFYTVDKSRSKRTDSTGLGLSIVKHIVERHQGELKLESEIDKGTEITVTFEA